jgi:serine/threonine protein kinase
MTENDVSALLGRTVAGKYVVEAVIGRGAAGMVFRARQIAVDRVVALKVLHKDLAHDEQFIRRFQREALAASRLDHPNSIRVLDFGHDDDGSPYLAMEYVEGRTLQEVIDQDGPLPDARVVDIVSQVLAALGVAHQMGVIHRDLKPDNIIVLRSKTDEGEPTELVKVCDFGIAALATTMVREDGTVPTPGLNVTMSGLIVGTPAYMSPEQMRAAPLDHRSDLYSVGILLYQLLAGRLPFQGDTLLALALKQATEPPPAPSTARGAAVNAGLELVCLKAISKRPEDRFASAREMRVALRGTPEPSILARARQTAWGLGTAVLVAGTIVGATWLFGARGRHREAPPAAAAAIVSAPAPPAPAPAPAAPAPAALTDPTAIDVPASADPELDGPAKDLPPPRERPVKRGKPSRHARAADASSAAPGFVAEAPPAPPVPLQAVEPPRHPAGPEAPPAGAGGAGVGSVGVAAPPAPPSRSASSANRSAAGAKLALAGRSSGGPRPAPPPSAPLDLDRAGVAVTAVATTSGIPGSNIRAAMSRVPFLRCYRDGLRAHGARAAGTANLRLDIDVSGYVTSATLQDAPFLPAMPAMKGCIETAARAARIRDVDTGDATAVVTLTFVAPP